MKNCLPSSHRSGQSSVRTSFKGKAEIGSDEDELTPLSQLKYGSHGCRVRVRISRMWVSFNPNDGTVFGLDSLLIDDKGKTMQARVLPQDMKQLEQRLVEGKVYALSDFTVDRKLKNYMTCKNDLMMYIGSHTVVDEIGDVDEIPLHSFEFVDFGDLPSRNRDNSLLTDVIGQIVYVCGIQQALKTKPLRRVLFREIQIQDLSGRTQNVTLYGNLGSHFDVELVLRKGQEAPVLAIFAGTCVRHYNGKGFIVCSISASKYYLDLEIAEVQEFCANLHNPKIPIAHLPYEQESTIDPIQELLSSWQTIEQLKSLSHNAQELHNTRYLCRACLTDIDCTRGWWYLGCFHCRRSISVDGNGTKFWCNGCGQNNPSPVPRRYKLDAKVEDDTSSMNFMVFGEQAQELVGVAAEELVEGIGDDDRYTVPDVLQGAPHSSHTFQVAFANGQFVVKGILDDAELVQLGDSVILVTSVQAKAEAAAAGFLLSQEDGSSALYGSNSLPSEMVQVETGLQTASEAEQGDAEAK